VLLLAEVALGKTNDLYNADYNAANLPPGTLSTKGIIIFLVIITTVLARSAVNVEHISFAIVVGVRTRLWLDPAQPQPAEGDAGRCEGAAGHTG